MVETVSAGYGEARLTEESKVGGRVCHLSFTVSGLQIYGEDCGVLLLSMAGQRGAVSTVDPTSDGRKAAVHGTKTVSQSLFYPFLLLSTPGSARLCQPSAARPVSMIRHPEGRLAGIYKKTVVQCLFYMKSQFQENIHITFKTTHIYT